MKALPASMTMRDLVAPIVRECLADHGAHGPLLISQRNSEAAVGIPARTFLDLIKRPDCPVPVRRVGKLRLVDARAFEVWLRTLDEQEVDSEPPADGADAVLAELGLRPVKRGAR